MNKLFKVFNVHEDGKHGECVLETSSYSVIEKLMYDLNVQKVYIECSFTESDYYLTLDEIKKKDARKYILEKAKYLKMRMICELSGISYQSYRNWKSDQFKFSLNIESLNRIITSIKTIPKETLIEPSSNVETKLIRYNDLTNRLQKSTEVDYIENSDSYQFYTISSSGNVIIEKFTLLDKDSDNEFLHEDKNTLKELLSSKNEEYNYIIYYYTGNDSCIELSLFNNGSDKDFDEAALNSKCLAIYNNSKKICKIFINYESK